MYSYFTLGDRKLNITNLKKCLGCIIADYLSDNNDINRHCSLRMIKYFSMLIVPISMDDIGCPLWTKYKSSSNRKLEVACKHIFRNFLKCNREGTTNQIIQLNVDPYDVIVKK